ncbi:MAG TPA: hypothetical protein VJZ00_03120, partial [Thermoanaerobaculia bacterium]|nr:hypothetical protein [Thermoanaerobaculia bacterium]
ELIRAARIIGAVTAVLIIASLAARRMIPAATLATLLIATCVAILLQMTVVLELAARERAAHRAFYARATLLAALLLAQASLFGWYQGTRIAGADLLGLTRLQRKGETETRRVLFVGTDRVYCVARKERGFEITPVEWDEVESLASPAPR